MKYLFILLSLLSSVSIAQTLSADKDKKLTVVVTAEQNGSPEVAEGFTITLLKDSVVQSTINQKQAKFSLDYKGIYMINVSKTGYNTKTFFVKTSGIPIERWNKGFEPLEVKAVIYTPKESVYTTVKTYIYNSDDDEFVPY